MYEQKKNMAEEEVVLEVEAVQAVYGDDCSVLDIYPPHLHLHIKPRTADVSSQQFVEAVIGMRAGPQYPEEPPHISIIDSKGLDEQRQKYLMTCIHQKASELTSYLMLVALCEEAVEQLSNMNHPDGDCPLCLSPLVDEDGGNKALPFMKLMSCFHCFHGECIMRWWNWLQNEGELTNAKSSSGRARDGQGTGEERVARCPVCRKIFLAKDIEHVLDLVDTIPLLDSSGSEVDDEEKIVHADSEIIRRQKFEAIFKLQQENSGLIEPKKDEVLLPGMYLPRPLPSAEEVEVSNKETVEQRCKQSAANTKSNNVQSPSSIPGSSRARNTNSRRNKGPTIEQHRREPASSNSESKARSTSNRPSTSKDRHINARKYNGLNSRQQQKQWIRKETDSTS